MIRCLVVDDSRTFRAVMRAILQAAPDVVVVGEAADGVEALARTLELRPDVLTMDVRMPRRDGLAALQEIMRVVPTPVVVVSAAGESEVSFEALRLGAIEVLPKPHAADPRRFEREADAIRLAVRAVSGLKLATRHRRREETRAPVRARATEIVGVASSTGGPAALQRILSALPADYPLPILVAQHIHAGFESSFVRWLGASTGRAVRLAAHGERPERGVVHVAAADRHLESVGRRLSLDDRPPVKSCRPSATILFESLARDWGASAAGLVLTGMGDDGAAGLLRLRAAGGPTFAQGPATSVVYGMPRAAVECGAAATSLELDEIPAALVALAARPEA
jgi:two-component system chemotaxis response regulator CheB